MARSAGARFGWDADDAAADGDFFVDIAQREAKSLAYKASCKSTTLYLQHNLRRILAIELQACIVFLCNDQHFPLKSLLGFADTSPCCD